MNVGPINHDDFCLECGSGINFHKSPPERVYLQWHSEDDEFYDGVTWAGNQINQCDPAYIRESPKVAAAIAAHDALVAACTRMLNLSSHCDYEGPEDAKPEDCPGIVENGFWCHWCQMRAALALALAVEGKK